MIEYKDFVGYYHNVYPEGYCKHIIDEFERLESLNAGSSRQQSDKALRHHKDDYQIFVDARSQPLNNFNNIPVLEMFFDGLQRCYEEYSSKYSVLIDGPSIRCTTIKMQRTAPGGGYHIWHGEQGNIINGNASRVLVYMLYLNSLPEDGAGETEFLYQQQRVKPEEGYPVLFLK